MIIISLQFKTNKIVRTFYAELMYSNKISYTSIYSLCFPNEHLLSLSLSWRYRKHFCTFCRICDGKFGCVEELNEICYNDSRQNSLKDHLLSRKDEITKRCTNVWKKGRYSIYKTGLFVKKPLQIAALTNSVLKRGQ